MMLKAHDALLITPCSGTKLRYNTIYPVIIVIDLVNLGPCYNY